MINEVNVGPVALSLSEFNKVFIASSTPASKHFCGVVAN